MLLRPGSLSVPSAGVLLWLAGLLTTVRAFTGCPRSCFCNEINLIVYCSRRGLSLIPEGIPRDSLQINLNGNVFRTPTISSANFSDFPVLEHLYLSECGIETIEVDTFAQLPNLKWLDLSNNRIRVVQDYTFRGLSLDHLFLNGNRNIQIRARSFAGLDSTGLYLHDSSLQRLAPDVLFPLNASLRYLWLNGNELERLDRKLLPIFQALSHLRLGSNPLHCNCEVIWLKEFYDKNSKIFSGAPPPSCLTPQKLRGKYFNALSLFEFRCQSPVFNNIDAMFDDNTGRLRCTAVGDPAPTLFWIRPTGESKRYAPPSDEEARFNEGILSITTQEKDEDLSGMYICLAFNEAGNVTLTLNVSWPGAVSRHVGMPQFTTPFRTTTRRLPVTSPTSTSSPLPEQPTLNPHLNYHLTDPPDFPQLPPDVNQNVLVSNSDSDSKGGEPAVNSNDRPYNFTALNMLEYKRRNGERLFNLTELVGAVIGTHVCTLLLCLIFMPIYLKRQWSRRQPHHGLEKAPNESLYLNGLTRLDYMDTPSPNKR